MPPRSSERPFRRPLPTFSAKIRAIKGQSHDDARNPETAQNYRRFRQEARQTQPQHRMGFSFASAAALRGRDTHHAD